jgi:antirestriction protein ArdC
MRRGTLTALPALLISTKREDYAREELVAELGAAFVSATIGIKLHDREDHAAYLANWLQALRNDKKCIFTAARLAQDASDWLLSRMAVETAPEWRRRRDRRRRSRPRRGRGVARALS